MLSDFKNVFARYKNSAPRLVCICASGNVITNKLHSYRCQFTFELLHLVLIFKKAANVPVLLLSDVLEDECAGSFF
jgi:hypothetical protein